MNEWNPNVDNSFRNIAVGGQGAATPSGVGVAAP
jgi:hypothetical protein